MCLSSRLTQGAPPHLFFSQWDKKQIERDDDSDDSSEGDIGPRPTDVCSLFSLASMRAFRLTDPLLGAPAKDDPLTDYEDDFGRTRTVPRSEVPIYAMEKRRLAKAALEEK